jgi:hypothetical protein
MGAASCGAHRGIDTVCGVEGGTVLTNQYRQRNYDAQCQKRKILVFIIGRKKNNSTGRVRLGSWGRMGVVMWRIGGPWRSSRSRVSAAKRPHQHAAPSSETPEEQTGKLSQSRIALCADPDDARTSVSHAHPGTAHTVCRPRPLRCHSCPVSARTPSQGVHKRRGWPMSTCTRVAYQCWAAFP